MISRLRERRAGEIGKAVVERSYRISKFTKENVFNLLLYSILEKNELSLKTIEKNYCRMFIFKYTPFIGNRTLKIVLIEYFKKVFLFVLQSFCSMKNQ
ncbi:hypothetical protein [Wolbachia endosymbiont of Litomosoides sigmodontis]|uniref:hypothetical protein n=1 Tax=Wolbachia endosymbiont of Litomosoides sigmodontis TaxID=80850 RepID=UPI00158EC064|nr:hypothetical protein [Wolbachia endosymbiont of Litomosoides sigmodontis]